MKDGNPLTHLEREAPPPYSQRTTGTTSTGAATGSSSSPPAPSPPRTDNAESPSAAPPSPSTESYTSEAPMTVDPLRTASGYQLKKDYTGEPGCCLPTQAAVVSHPTVAAASPTAKGVASLLKARAAVRRTRLVASRRARLACCSHPPNRPGGDYRRY